MSQTASGTQRKQKWYNKYIFPIVPVITVKKANEHNTSGFSLRWLCFHCWSLDCFGFEFAIVADTHWGIGVIGILPYLRWVVAIPCPEKISVWFDRKLNRIPKG